ncbi:hypothetical protein [Arenimonas composti]|uniref:Outer membrane protein beta-barrel domain-containing protein n=1 Tax=Arenimonas composti TR7-09 = DSM 18010 TaxID=1121013 RepID=A0A091B8E4_9GAMM|nr:hypothetical protein [Arenimonas composti]KFN48913.1 hypothetical protein P873_13250 [Arenimonas composti TR7-09 = DSM 18010]
MPTQRLFVLAVALAVALTLATPVATASDSGDRARPLDRVSLWAGALNARSDTRFAFSADNDTWSGEGDFGLEDDLGLDRRATVGHGRLDVLVGRANGLSLEYFGYARDTAHRLERRIEWDGQVFDTTADVSGAIEFGFASAAWRWWMGEGATVFGLGLGVAHYRVETAFDGEATVNGGTASASLRTSDAAMAPLASLGWRHAFSERWRAYADLSGVTRDSGPLQGHIVDAGVGFEWFPTRHWGLALEYGATHIRLDRVRGEGTLRFDLDLRGPSLFLRVR